MMVVVLIVDHFRREHLREKLLRHADYRHWWNVMRHHH
jgi:hypothetical protein